MNIFLLNFHPFLDASSHLYMRVCPSVGPSVRPSVGPSVRLKRILEISKNSVLGYFLLTKMVKKELLMKLSFLI